MESAIFTAYARKTQYDSHELKQLGIRLDHVFVTSSVHNNWNCFGGGIEEASKEHEIASSRGIADWANHVYGSDNEGKLGRHPNAFPAAGVTELYNGVCQSAANRILVFTETNIDVWKANANAIVTFLYGKYGFDTSTFVSDVKRAANVLRIPEAETTKVLDRISEGQTAESELCTLKRIFEFRTGKPFPVIPDAQWFQMVQAHSAFQTRRNEEFEKLARVKFGQDIRKDLVDALMPDLISYYKLLEGIIGEDNLLNMMQVLPPNIALALRAFGGRWQ